MILLLGASGYVGSEFVRRLTVAETPFVAIRRSDCNIYSPDDLAKCLDFHEATHLINCAGYTGKPNVDACESDKGRCVAGNVVLPSVIAEACQRVGIDWGHVSSGCIFTGKREDGLGFSEEDPPNFSFRQDNCSFYSGTKALGEEALSEVDNCYIWRLRIPFSNVDSSRNYLSKLLRYPKLLEAENSLSNLPEFVSAALNCFNKSVPYGIYNLTNPGTVMTSDVVKLIQESGVADREFQFFNSEDEFMRLAAITPRSNCVLDSSKAIAAGLRLTDVRQSIADMLTNWIPETAPVTS